MHYDLPLYSRSFTETLFLQRNDVVKVVQCVVYLLRVQHLYRFYAGLHGVSKWQQNEEARASLFKELVSSY